MRICKQGLTVYIYLSWACNAFFLFSSVACVIFVFIFLYVNKDSFIIWMEFNNNHT